MAVRRGPAFPCLPSLLEPYETTGLSGSPYSIRRPERGSFALAKGIQHILDIRSWRLAGEILTDVSRGMAVQGSLVPGVRSQLDDAVCRRRRRPQQDDLVRNESDCEWL